MATCKECERLKKALKSELDEAWEIVAVLMNIIKHKNLARATKDRDKLEGQADGKNK